MTSILYNHGAVGYSTQKRIFSGTGSEQIASEIIRSVSNLQQFQITQGNKEPIDEIHLAGVDAAVISACQENIGSLGNDISVKRMQVDKNIRFPGTPQEACSYLFPIGGMMPGKKEINLVAVTKRKVKKKQESIGVLRILSLPLILLLGCSAITGALQFQNQVKQMELDELNACLTDENNLTQVGRADYLENQIMSLQLRLDSIRRMNGIIASYPLMNSRVLAQLQDCTAGYAQLTVLSYSADSGLLSVDATAEEVTMINQFIDRLQASGLFERLDYTGYTYDENAQMYTINVSCCLAEQAGR